MQCSCNYFQQFIVKMTSDYLFMNNEAIAVKCSLHGPQIVWERQSSSYVRVFSYYCRPWEGSGRMHYVNLIFPFWRLDNRGCVIFFLFCVKITIIIIINSLYTFRMYYTFIRIIIEF